MSAEYDVVTGINILSIILIKGSHRQLVELWLYYVILNKNLNGGISLFFVKAVAYVVFLKSLSVYSASIVYCLSMR